uniref:Uncharacterized protein n=1 Tax=Cyanothece sp. (strain PCC 7425 / ATCC 29141) TaxID=395961 RepID=B8HV37_CYAP4
MSTEQQLLTVTLNLPENTINLVISAVTKLQRTFSQSSDA